jgi:DNA polymerase-3 subunit alpha
MLHLVELLDEAVDVQIGNQRFGAPSIIENDVDGSRFLLIASDHVTHAQWIKASSSGVNMLMKYADGLYHQMTDEDFARGYTEIVSLRVLAVPEHAWVTSPEPLTIAALMNRAPWDPPRKAAFVHLHAHSEYSALDGLATVTEMVETAAADGDPAVAVTDHGVCAAHPQLQTVCNKVGIKPVFGIEANFVDDRLLRGNPEIKEGPGSAQDVLVATTT